MPIFIHIPASLSIVNRNIDMVRKAGKLQRAPAVMMRGASRDPRRRMNAKTYTGVRFQRR